LLIFLAFFVVGCGSLGTEKNINNDDVISFSIDDPEMNAAIQEAQATLGTFVAALQSPKSSQTYFSIKARFPYGDQGAAEHIWLEEVSYDGKYFNGKIANDVYYVPNLQYGDAVAIIWGNVSDWMIIENGKLIGGYTICVMYCRMSPQEQQQFLEENQWFIEESCNQGN
jgi:uncharacterized protein YegJ (DUF2314 family)